MSDNKNLTVPDSKPFSKKHRMKDIDTRTANYKRMLRLLEQRMKELPLLQFRKRLIEKQGQMSYQDDYDKLRSLFHTRSMLPASTTEYLDRRQGDS